MAVMMSAARLRLRREEGKAGAEGEFIDANEKAKGRRGSLRK